MSPDLPIVRCAGGPRQRGQAHGEALRALIRAMLARWLAALQRAGRPDPQAYVRDFLQQTDYAAAMTRWTPSLLDEIRGIAEGAAVPFDELFAYNLLDEEWWFAKNYARPAPGCTVIGWRAAEGDAPVLAQTMDIGALYDGAQAVLHICRDETPEALVFTFAGMIGLNGCNAAGVGVVVNNLAMLPHAPRGLPVAAVVRGILEHRTLGDATAFLRDTPHASGQHYAVGSPEGMSSFECSARGVVQHTAATNCILHTNHPLTDHYQSAGSWDNSRARYDFIAARAGSIGTQADVEALLADQSVPVSIACKPGRTFTFGATSMMLSSPPQLRIAPGPPHISPFIGLSFDA
jgi:isopenicillin-N N-acyltransferase-like protein